MPRIVTAIAMQLAAAALLFAAVRVSGIPITAFQFALACGLLAALATAGLRFEAWWIGIQFLLPLLLWTFLWFDIPSWIFLVLLLSLGLIFSSTIGTRVPLYLSNRQTWQAVEALLPAPDPTQTLRFADLGSGLGGLLFYLTSRRPDVELLGIELAPLPAWLSQLRALFAGRHRLQIRWGSFWSLNLEPYDVVFVFLSPVPMAKLWDKAQREMRPGTLFVSCAFEVPGQRPDRTIELSSPRQPRLLVWQIAPRK